ncbi:MAG: FAD-binding protein [Bacteriovoracaceae bacterium]|nr:FAD-binding protein [Bacteriovoracaceae bacterium]
MGQQTKVLEKLNKNIEGIEVHFQHDFTKLSTIRLNSVGTLVIVKDKNSLCDLLKEFKNEKIEYKVLGQGANILLPEVLPWVVVQLKFDFDKSYLNEAHESYDLPASISLSVLSSHATKFGLSGWEVITGIPASLGGAIYMNAGTSLGEIGELISEVEYVDESGKIKTHKVEKNSFSYRKNNFLKKGDIVISAKLLHKGEDPKISKKIKSYLEKRNQSQPLNKFTCGCIFKNSTLGDISCRAGHYVDIIGMKGFTLGGVRVSHKHGNFLENFNGSNYPETMQLMKLLQKEMKLQYGVEFEFEVEH